MARKYLGDRPVIDTQSKHSSLRPGFIRVKFRRARPDGTSEYYWEQVSSEEYSRSVRLEKVSAGPR